MSPALPARWPKVGGVEVELSDREKRGINIWEQMREIEGELFLLSGRSEALDLENRVRAEQLCAQRTQLAGELLLMEQYASHARAS
jgi:hypothetical protein